MKKPRKRKKRWREPRRDLGRFRCHWANSITAPMAMKLQWKALENVTSSTWPNTAPCWSTIPEVTKAEMVRSLPSSHTIKSPTAEPELHLQPPLSRCQLRYGICPDREFKLNCRSMERHFLPGHGSAPKKVWARRSRNGRETKKNLVTPQRWRDLRRKLSTPGSSSSVAVRSAPALLGIFVS